ncbi:unnamed protein product, partial [Mesorhabditis spiculigera]
MKLLVFASLLCLVVAEWETSSNITVTGTVVCQSRRQPGIRIDLMSTGVITNDLLNSTTSTPQGDFTIFGHKKEFGELEPLLYIYHNCRTIRQGCQTRSVYPVPQSDLLGVYDMTFVILDVVTADETAVNCQ